MPDLPEHHSLTAHTGPRARPKNWGAFCACVRYKWLAPFTFFDWILQWVAYAMSHFSLLEVLEYCGSFSILIAVVFYFIDAPERTKSKHYQAWQVINTAQGKGGSGGRTDALHELNEDHVPLVGVDVSEAFLQGIDLQHADLLRSDFHSADLRNARLMGSSMVQSHFESANLRGADLSKVNLSDADFRDTDLNGAILSGATLQRTRLDFADLRGANLSGITNWDSIGGITLANIHGVQNAPVGFVDWAIKHHAVDAESDEPWSSDVETEKKRIAAEEKAAAEKQ
jgi:uncharacterized protein YjbI with pentapeptide repeats